MREIKLVFDGRAFPAASVRPFVLRGTNPSGDPLDLVMIDVAERGNGRRWSTSKPLAFWRTFAEAHAADEAAVLDIVTRYGDPDSTLQPGTAAHTGNWYRWATLLALIGHAWGKPDRDGISHVHGDFVAEDAANLFMRDRQLFDVRLDLDLSLQPVARAARLGDFMLASAAFMLARKTPMRRCAECGHWTDASHAATRYCGNACRLKATRKREAA